MDRELKDTEVLEGLARLGLDEKERRFYMAALDCPGASVTDLAAKASLGRTQGYDLVERLVSRGLLKKMPGASGQRVVAEDPGVLLSEWRDVGQILDKLVPALRSRTNRSGQRPSIRLYEGMGQVERALDTSMSYGSAAATLFIGLGLVDICVSAKTILRLVGRGRLVSWPTKVLLAGDEAWAEDPRALVNAGAQVRVPPLSMRSCVSVVLQGEEALFVVTGVRCYAVHISGRELVDSARAIFDQAWDQSACLGKGSDL